MMPHESFGGGEGCADPVPSRSKGRPGGPAQQFVDRCTLVILTIAALVAGTLSAWGAHAMFPGGWAIPIAFAVVVQLCVSMSLWALPQTPLLRRMLLFLAWGTAVFFSVASGYYTIYQHNSQEVVAYLVDEVRQSFTVIKKRTEADQSGAAIADDQLRSEIDNGTFNEKRKPGDGPEAQQLRRIALSAQARAREATAVSKIVDTALAQLKQPELTIEEVRTIYSSTLYQVGKYGDGITPVAFDDDKRSFITISINAFNVVTGKDATASPVERTRVLGSLGSASIMELLALISSLIRMEMHRVPRGNNPRGGGGWLERLMSLAHLRKQLNDSWFASKILAREATVARVVRWRKAASDLDVALQGEPPERVWSDMLEAHTRNRSYRKAILELLPDYVAIRGANDDTANISVKSQTPAAVFDARVFGGKPIVLQAAVATQAILCVRGRLLPGPRWQAWVRFLIGALANPPPRRPNRVAGGRPKLKVVGG